MQSDYKLKEQYIYSNYTLHIFSPNFFLNHEMFKSVFFIILTERKDIFIFNRSHYEKNQEKNRTQKSLYVFLIKNEM